MRTRHGTGGPRCGGGAAVGGFAALGADQVRDVEHEAAQLSPSGGQGPCALRGAVAGAGNAVDDGGQHDGDVGLLVVVAEVHRVGLGEGALQVAGELVEPAEQVV